MLRLLMNNGEALTINISIDEWTKLVEDLLAERKQCISLSSKSIIIHDVHSVQLAFDLEEVEKLTDRIRQRTAKLNLELKRRSMYYSL
jgi:hypothetical protein